MLIKETSDMTEAEKQTVHNQNNSYLETGIQKVLADSYNIDELKFNGKFAILNATGTLPSGYSADDNNFFIECYMWLEHYGRQVLHDVRTNRTFSRNLFNDEWQPFEFIDYIVESGTTDIWTWEKWNSGKAVCWCKTITSDSADPASIYFKQLLLPFEFTNDNYIVLITSYQSTGVGSFAFQYYKRTTTEFWVGSNDPSITANVYVIGKWK